MKHKTMFTYEFVDYIPDDLKDGTLYVSVAFATAVHKCCCGCGREVVTPLSPTDWKLIFDGETISLDPSIGNWNFPCQSHYWIRHNKVMWAPRLSQKEIKTGRYYDRLAKERYFDNTKTVPINDASVSAVKLGEGKSEENLWRKLKKRFSRKT